MLAVIILIIIIFVYISSYGRSGRDSKLSDKEYLARQGRLDRLEGVYLEWIILATVFLIMTFRVKGFEPGSIYFSIIFMIITILIFIIANVEYLYERVELYESGITVLRRMDYLFCIVTIVILTCIFLLYDMLKNDRESPFYDKHRRGGRMHR